MVARSHVLETKSAQKNSPLVLSAILTSVVKKYLTSIEREDIAQLISTVILFGDSVTIVTSRPIINFELRMYERGIKDVFTKTLNNHGFSSDIRLLFR